MHVVEVIEARVWRGPNGRTVSIRGAVPWTRPEDKALWTMATVGWTWRNSNGTIGLGRVPAKTREEAIEIMERVNAGRDINDCATPETCGVCHVCQKPAPCEHAGNG
jgi:hypothetical protein